MEILYISQYYPPEMGAPSARVSELSKYWAKMGHNVTVITGMPNHPDGIIHPSYKWEYFKEEKKYGVKVLRTFLYVTPNKGVIKRIISFISFMISSLIVGLLKSGTDIIIATSPQFFVGLSGLIISRIKKKPFVFEVRDIWPQSAVELGVIRNKYIIKAMEYIEELLYKKADIIIVVVREFVDIIKNKGISESKIKYLPNGVDVDRFKNAKKDIHFIKKYNLENKLTIAYIGTLGMAHALDFLIKAAPYFNDKIRFLLIGDGAEKEKLNYLIKKNNIKNIILMEKIPATKVPDILQSIDIGFVHLKDVPLMEKALPSKIFELMAAGKPVLAGIKGTAKRLIEYNNAGFVFEPENVNSLLDVLNKILKMDKKELEKIGASGKQLILEQFQRKELAKKYISYLKELKV